MRASTGWGFAPSPGSIHVDVLLSLVYSQVFSIERNEAPLMMVPRR